MATIFHCRNCKWEGTSEELKYDLLDYMCPECENLLTTDGALVGQWDYIVEDDDEDTDYGDFPDQDSPY